MPEDRSYEGGDDTDTSAACSRAGLEAVEDGGWLRLRLLPADQQTGALPLCPVLLADGSTCLRVVREGHECPHAAPGPAPEAIQRLVTDLRQQVAEARDVARALASLVRYLRGERGVTVAIRPEPPWWLAADAPEWPPS